jgi:hypothetical protein
MVNYYAIRSNATHLCLEAIHSDAPDHDNQCHASQVAQNPHTRPLAALETETSPRTTTAAAAAAAATTSSAIVVAAAVCLDQTTRKRI